MTRIFLAATVVSSLLFALSSVSASAKGSVWHNYNLYVANAKVEGGTGTYRARLSSILLPDAFKVRKRSRSLTFGPYGGCRSTGTITPVLVSSSAATKEGVLAEQVKGGTTYGSGTSGDAAYRIAKFKGGALKGAYVRPISASPGTWIVVRVTTTPHTSCHVGGVRESLGYPLAMALATTKASGY